MHCTVPHERQLGYAQLHRPLVSPYFSLRLCARSPSATTCLGGRFVPSPPWSLFCKLSLKRKYCIKTPFRHSRHEMHSNTLYCTVHTTSRFRHSRHEMCHCLSLHPLGKPARLFTALHCTQFYGFYCFQVDINYFCYISIK